MVDTMFNYGDDLLCAGLDGNPQDHNFGGNGDDDCGEASPAGQNTDCEVVIDELIFGPEDFCEALVVIE